MNGALAFACLVVLMGFSACRARATTIDFTFDATLDSGTLTGSSFTGIGSYNAPAVVSPGLQYLELTSLDFSLDDQVFTLADNYQGGQAILDDGTLAYFTAAFLPEGSIQTIAFGFGGPGIIGYETYGQFGEGSYTIPSEVPEPGSALLCSIGTGLLVAVCLRRKRCGCPLLVRNVNAG